MKDDRLIHRSMGEIDWQCDEGICEHTDRVAGKCACYNKEIGMTGGTDAEVLWAMEVADD